MIFKMVFLIVFLFFSLIIELFLIAPFPVLSSLYSIFFSCHMLLFLQSSL